MNRKRNFVSAFADPNGLDGMFTFSKLHKGTAQPYQVPGQLMHKWGPQPDVFDQEDKIKQLQPPMDQLQDTKLKFDEEFNRLAAKKGGVAKVHQQKEIDRGGLQYIGKQKYKQQWQDAKWKVNDQFTKDFMCWVLGNDPKKNKNHPAYVKAREKEHNINRKPGQRFFGKDIDEWLGSFIDKKAEFMKKLTYLKMGPNKAFPWNLNHYWLFYKYILRGLPYQADYVLSEFDTFFPDLAGPRPDPISPLPDLTWRSVEWEIPGDVPNASNKEKYMIAKEQMLYGLRVEPLRMSDWCKTPMYSKLTSAANELASQIDSGLMIPPSPPSPSAPPAPPPNTPDVSSSSPSPAPGVSRSSSSSSLPPLVPDTGSRASSPEPVQSSPAVPETPSVFTATVTDQTNAVMASDTSPQTPANAPSTSTAINPNLSSVGILTPLTQSIIDSLNVKCKSLQKAKDIKQATEQQVNEKLSQFKTVIVELQRKYIDKTFNEYHTKALHDLYGNYADNPFTNAINDEFETELAYHLAELFNELTPTFDPGTVDRDQFNALFNGLKIASNDVKEVVQTIRKEIREMGEESANARLAIMKKYNQLVPTTEVKARLADEIEKSNEAFRAKIHAYASKAYANLYSSEVKSRIKTVMKSLKAFDNAFLKNVDIDSLKIKFTSSTNHLMSMLNDQDNVDAAFAVFRAQLQLLTQADDVPTTPIKPVSNSAHATKTAMTSAKNSPQALLPATLAVVQAKKSVPAAQQQTAVRYTLAQSTDEANNFINQYNGSPPASAPPNPEPPTEDVAAPKSEPAPAPAPVDTAVSAPPQQEPDTAPLDIPDTTPATPQSQPPSTTQAPSSAPTASFTNTETLKSFASAIHHLLPEYSTEAYYNQSFRAHKGKQWKTKLTNAGITSYNEYQEMRNLIFNMVFHNDIPPKTYESKLNKLGKVFIPTIMAKRTIKLR